MHTYNIDDPYYTGQIDPPGIIKIIYDTCMHMDTCESNTTIIIANYCISSIRRRGYYLRAATIQGWQLLSSTYVSTE